MGAGGAGLVFYLLFGLWIFARPHKSEHATGEQKAADSKDNHGQPTETGKPDSTERGSEEPKSPPLKPETKNKRKLQAPVITQVAPSKDDLLPDISDSMLRSSAMEVSVVLRKKWDAFNGEIEHLENQRMKEKTPEGISKLNKKGNDLLRELWQEPLLNRARAILKEMNARNDHSMEQDSLREIVNRIKDIQYQNPDN